MLESLAELYKQLGGLGTAITLVIILVFIGALYANVLIRRRYLSLSEELAGYCSGDLKELRSEVLLWITEEYKAAAQTGGLDINTASIIDTGLMAFLKLCKLGEAFIKRSNALLVTTGLFGTFVGLTYAVGNIGNILADTDAEAFMGESGADTLAVLVSSFQGMAVAFITSLFGTGFSILNMIITSFVSASEAKQLLLSQLEEFLDIRIASELRENVHKDEKKDAEVLASSMTAFEKVVSDYSASLKGLKSFNEELSANLLQVRESFTSLATSMDNASGSISGSSTIMHDCSESLITLTQEISYENKRLAQLAGVMSKLQESLLEDKRDREVFLKAVYEIPDRLLNYQEAAVARADRKGG